MLSSWLCGSITHVSTARPLNVGEKSVASTKPLPNKANRGNEFITIYTDADVTWCRPWPNTAVYHTNSAHFYRGTMLNLTCWVHNDIPEPEDGPGLSSPADIWVKTSDNGCYINENDLRSAEIVFEDQLNLCRAPGPHQTAGSNRPESQGEQAVAFPPISNSSSAESVPPFIVVPPSSNLPPSNNQPPTNNLPPYIPPVNNNPPVVNLPPVSNTPTLNNSSPYFQNSAPVFPNPSLIPSLPQKPSPTAFALPIATPANLNGGIPSISVPSKSENGTKTSGRRRYVQDRNSSGRLIMRLED